MNMDLKQTGLKILKITLNEVTSDRNWEIIKDTWELFESSDKGIIEDHEKAILEVLRVTAGNVLISCFVDGENKDITPWLTKISSHEESITIKRDQFEKAINNISFSSESKNLILDLVSELEKKEVISILETIHYTTIYESLEITGPQRDLTFEINGDLDIKHRKGAFYTPEEITEVITQNTIERKLNKSNDIDEHGIKIIDPACGTGAFLIKAFEILFDKCTSPLSSNDSIPPCIKSKSPEEVKRFIVENCLYGIDTDPASLELTRLNVALISGTLKNENVLSKLEKNIKIGNALISPIDVEETNLFREKLKKLSETREEKDIDPKCKKVKEELRKKIESGKTFVDLDSFFEKTKLLKPFIWQFEFPEVFLEGGFDCVIMNPPYDQLKPNRSEFFKNNNSLSHTAKKKKFKEAMKLAEERDNYFRKSGHYSLSLSDNLNLYKLMVERSIKLSSDNASIGFIVPHTISSDKSTSQLRKHLLEQFDVFGIIQFTEKAKVFDGVSQAVDVVLVDKQKTGEKVNLISGQDEVKKEFRNEDFVEIPNTVIQEISPKYYSIPKTSMYGWEILKKIHEHQTISDIQWLRNHRGELDLTLHKKYVSTEKTDSQLIRGNHVKRFSLDWESEKKPSFVKKDEFLCEIQGSMKVKHLKKMRLCGQQVSNMDQMWRLKFSTVNSGKILANSCNYILIDKKNSKIGVNDIDLDYMLGLLNSAILNWRFKLTSSNNHVNNYELDALPIKIPRRNEEDILYETLVENVKKIKKNYSIELDTKIQATTFCLYDISQEEARYILDSLSVKNEFKEEILKNMDELTSTIK